jgi:Rrf2 family nitric oxide-sensitive transcriptional repressor
VLLYLGRQPERLSPIAEIAGAYAISKNHLMKVVNDLVNAGYLESVRGRHGGIRLARPPEEINVGALIRHTEDSFDLVDCGSCQSACKRDPLSARKRDPLSRWRKVDRTRAFALRAA